jgi:hypothetical protein
MTTGPGKYNELCTYVREKAEALGVVVLIFEGNQGNGFSVQAPPSLAGALPAMLRDMANQIEADSA